MTKQAAATALLLICYPSTSCPGAAGKPEKIVDKIVAGRLDKFYGEVCLLEQAFIMDSDHKVRVLTCLGRGRCGCQVVHGWCIVALQMWRTVNACAPAACYPTAAAAAVAGCS